MRTLLLSLIFFLGAAMGCAGHIPAPAEAPKPPEDTRPWAERTLTNMTLEEKVGQLLHVWIQFPYYSEDAPVWKEIQRNIRERHIGGIVASVGDVYEFAIGINKLQKISKVPLLVGADFEYGVGMRIKRSTTFPRAMAIGATRNQQFAYEAGRITAIEGRALGVHQNYAPTLDVNNNPKNPVINTRSFGDDVALVSAMGAAFVKGTQDGGLVATIKHFPGHGDTDIDTHLNLPTLKFSRARMDSLELPPFREGLNAGAQSVMVGHLSVPAYDSVAGIPSTVSPRVTTGLLRDSLGFTGLIVTDAMVMEGVASRYQAGEAAVLAVKAGIDLILMPVNLDIAFEAIVSAVQRGEVSEARIDASVKRLLEIKHQMGLDANPFSDVDRLSSVINTRDHQLAALDIARHAITVLGNDKGVLPFSKVDQRSMCDIVISDEEDPEDGRNFDRQLRSRWSGAVSFTQLDPRSNSQEYDSTLARASRADLIVLQLHIFTRSGAMTGFVDPKHVEFVKKLIAFKKPVVGISFGNPYITMDLPAFDAYVLGYSDADVIQQAMGEVLFAEEPAQGKLPINIPGRYAFGDGVTWAKQTLGVGFPEEVSMSSDLLTKVDEVMTAAVHDSAFPGGVVYAARKGVVVYTKAFGTYDTARYSKAVDISTIYDMASVTKVIATTSAVMKLVDEKRISLNDPIVKYIPAFGQRGKEKITITNLMVHNSGLPGWRKFYEFCNDPSCVRDSVFATPLVYQTGDSMIYSDLGLITMMAVVEKVTKTTLDRYVDSVFFKPLGMKSTMYNPSKKLLNRIAPTEVDNYWKRTNEAVRGRVHDENAATLGGVSGHAGLFSTAPDLGIILQMLLNGGTYGGKRYISEETVKLFTTRTSDKSSRAIGWDTKSSERSFSGHLTSMRTFLHTGFTGTSVVVDPESQMVIVLLTNRVHPTRANNKLSQVRPRLHDAIMGAIVK